MNDSVSSHEAIQKLADSQSFQRGEKYYRQERVHNLGRADTLIEAKVMGSRPYKVTLELDSFTPTCSCPVGTSWCKHAVALGLTLADTDIGTLEPANNEIKQWLEGLDKTKIIDLLLKRTDTDLALETWLTLQSTAPDGLDREIIMQRAVMIRDGFIDGWADTWCEYTQEARVILDILEAATESQPEEVRAVAKDLNIIWEEVSGFLDEDWCRLDELYYLYE